MMRRLLQSALCFVLCPLLVAQQTASSEQSPTAPDLASAAKPKVATITLPRKTVVELALLETVSSATAQKGQAVRLVVKKDVVVNGTVVIPRGTPASRQVTSVHKAVLGKTDGSIQIKPISLTPPDGSSIVLRGYTYNDDDADGVCEGFVSCLALSVIIVSISLPLVVAFWVASPFQRHLTRKLGFDETLDYCRTLWGSTKTKIRVNKTVPDQGGLSQPTIDAESPCAGNAVPTPSFHCVAACPNSRF
jgi:hypothetical protein